MKYLGSKRRIAKEILPIILAERNTRQQWYVEPFCGGCNSLDKVKGNRIGNDINPYLIALLKEMQKDDLVLPYIGEEEYNNIRKNKDVYPDWLVGYVGFQLSFGAKWFGGYRRDATGIRNYEEEALKNIRKQQKNLKNIIFYCGNYWEFHIPEQSIIYCDPPYTGTTGYENNFDHNFFWKWCKNMVNLGHIVFVSEYNAPTDWHCIWKKEVNTGVDVQRNFKSTEKLFIFKSQKTLFDF